MKIIILGAGQVGGTLAYHLAKENHDITVIDHNQKVLAKLQERCDLRTLVGTASHPNLLEAAGGFEADMIIAVTSSDEANMIACQIAHMLFKTPTKIARIRALQYLAMDGLFGKNSLPVDVIISPEQLVTNQIRRLIDTPNALHVFDLSSKQLRLVAVEAMAGGPIVSKPVNALGSHLPDITTEVMAIFRNDKIIIPEEHTLIHNHDEIYFIAAKSDVRKVMAQFRNVDLPNKKVIIVGGGNIGARLALALEQDYQVKIIEKDSDRAEHLANILSNTIVLHGDASDNDLLLNESIETTDIFCSVTNCDEINIMSSMLAKKLGANKTMALINRNAYVQVIEESGIDLTISPHYITISCLLSHIRKANVIKAHSIHHGKAEVIEVKVQDDTDLVIGKKITDIPLPDSAVISVATREGSILTPQDAIAVGDSLIIFLSDKKCIPQIEQLFHSESHVY